MTLGSLTLLIAGPEASRAGVLRQAIDGSGAAIERDESGDHAAILRIFDGRRIDCAIIDLAVVAAEGGALIPTLRARGIDAPIILVTSEANGTEAAEAFDGALLLALSEHSAATLAFSIAVAAKLGRAESRARAAETRLARELVHDPLTGLPSRQLLIDRLAQSLSLAQREKSGLAVMVIDINRFGDFNRAHGREIGDRLLQEVALRLRARLRHSDSLARLENDAFGVLLPTGGTFSGALNAANKLMEALKAPVEIGALRMTPTVSIGISVFPSHATDGPTLLARAEDAALEARGNRGGLVVWSGPDEGPIVGPFALAGDLRHAIDHGELVLHYQPKVDLKTGELKGVEALIRWYHPTLGLLMPDTFVPLAERTGWVEAITIRILDIALERVATWRKRGLDLPVSVNLSAVSLHNEHLPDEVGAMLEKWGVPAEFLTLELTESAIISDAKLANAIARRLNDMGVKISIDDFGSGFTSFAYVRAMPVSEVKIDKSFVQSMGSCAEDKVIVRLIVELGHTLGLDIVAEGIENADTLALLSEIGCGYGQGFHISRALDPAAIETWVAARTPWVAPIARTAS